MKNIKYSQNFLKEKSLIKNLLEKTSISKKDTVIEIGAGKGIITEKLVKRCNNVVAIEKDQKLFLHLKERFKDIDNISLINNDFLEEDLDFNDKKIFSNIPFNITTEIINKITNSDNSPIDSYIFLQKDAAKRFAGRQYNAKENLFSLLLKPWFDISVIHNFSSTDFTPKPSVDIVLMRIKKREKPLFTKEQKEKYNDFLSYAFSQWEPNIKGVFKKIFSYEQMKRLAKDLDFDLSDKLTSLSFEQYIGLFDYFLVGVSEEKKRQTYGSYTKLKNRHKGLDKIYRSRTSKSWKQQNNN